MKGFIGLGLAVVITVIPDGTLLNPGLKMTWEPLTNVGGGAADTDVFEGSSFDVSVLHGGAQIHDVSFVVFGSSTGTATYGGNVATIPGKQFGLFTTSGVPDEVNFAPVSTVSVDFGPGPNQCIECAVVFDGAGGSSTVTGMAFHFSEVVPEPATFALMVTGLVGLSVVRRGRTLQLL